MTAVSTPTEAKATLPTRRKTQPCAKISSVAWMPTREMDLPEWIVAGRNLGAMGRCGQWGLGDWIRYGNTQFGERYAEAARITGYDVQSLMNMVYVASKFEISRRRENLSWSHHETVTPLEADEQDYWLDLAVSQNLSVFDLRLELRSSRRDSKPAAYEGKGTNAVSASAKGLICPHCGGEVPLPPDGA
jgi:hypothetical protein